MADTAPSLHGERIWLARKATKSKAERTPPFQQPQQTALQKRTPYLSSPTIPVDTVAVDCRSSSKFYSSVVVCFFASNDRKCNEQKQKAQIQISFEVKVEICRAAR